MPIDVSTQNGEGEAGKIRVKYWYLFLATIVIATDISILLDLPLLRQTLGFLCFTIVPGLLVIHILSLEKAGFLKKTVLSIGLSIPILIFSGLLMSVLLPPVGFTQPLSSVYMLAFLNIIIGISKIEMCKKSMCTVECTSTTLDSERIF